MCKMLRKTVARFQTAEDGAIAIIFAIALAALIALCGLAIDVGRAVHAKSQIAAAIDAAALAAAKGLRLQNLSDADTIALAERMFHENLNASGQNIKGTHAQIQNVNVVVDRPNSAVTLTVDADVGTLFGGVSGVKQLAVPTTGAAIFEAQDIEVSVQLDVTGSMKTSNKIGDLKTATKQLVDVLIPDTPTGQKVRIGYAPFAAGINAGSYAGAVSGGVPAPDDCLYERLNINYQDTDNFPAGGSVFKTLSTLPSAMKCPDAKILPLTDDKSLLKSTVDAYAAKGCTAGHLGTSWAWNILSPAWAPIWPAASKPDPYNNGKTKKVAILMTDGEYNTVAGAGCNSAVSVVSSNHAKETCTAMKAKGVVVYTVGFMLNKASAKAVMSHCASDSGKAYEAQNGAQLIGAFKDIAESINRLRLSS